jgi:dUTP pyrophosphatase
MINVHAGLIDSNYRGEIQVCLINHGDRAVEIKKGDRVAQMVIGPYLGESIEVEELSDSERGGLGFGSSGV